MADSTKLVLAFNTADSSVTMTFNEADPDVQASDVQALAQGIIENGSIFVKVPVSAKSAKIVETTETEIPISA